MTDAPRSSTRERALRELARACEAIEADAWRDVWACAAPGVAATLGLRTRDQGGTLALAADSLESLLMNRVVCAGVGDPLDAAALDTIAAHYEGRQPFAWNVSPVAKPDGLEEALAARGYATYFHHVRWVRDVSAYAPARTTALRVERVGAADAHAWAGLSAEVFAHGSPLVRDWLAALPTRERWQVFAAWDGDALAGGAALYVRGTFAWLGMGAAREAHRGKGAQTALLAARIAAAAAAGAQWLTTETGPNWPELDPVSWRNVERAGFGVLYERPSWILPPRA
ncbi:MAG: hypothetical protein U0704_15185 [Candidatus Eisenbacteria bacterium]